MSAEWLISLERWQISYKTQQDKKEMHNDQSKKKARIKKQKDTQNN